MTDCRNGLDYTFDSLSRQTTEKWYNNLTDADVPQNVQKTYTTTYDEAGRVASIGDGDYDFDYTYSIFGNLTSTTQDLTGLTDDVEFSYGYDVLGRKTSVSAAVGSTDDYVNAYSYDALGRITQITQDGVTGGNAVAEKRVDFGYSDDGTRATISRFADLAGTKAVAETEKVFDELGRVADIVHERAATDFADYDLTWDAAGRISDFDFTSLVGNDGDAAYSYDNTNQLTASDYASDWQTDESYTYDDNGNRTNSGYTTGDHNRLTSDGTYNYTYDNEGNRTARFVDNDSSGTLNTGDTSITEYTWDHRDRLTKVTTRATHGGAATKIIECAYDHGQRWVRKTLDTNADGTIEESRVFVHDNGQIVLDFQKTGTASATNADLANRYLWGNSVDELLADEATDDDTAWALPDHLNSVRDLVVYDPVTGTVSVVKHVAYDAYGNVTSDSAAAVKSLFLYTARPFDADTDLQNNQNRWYDLTTGRWMSVDPIGFEAEDANLYAYANNCPVSHTDPSGHLGIKREGFHPNHSGSIDPTDAHKATSSAWRWVFNHVNDAPSIAQRVETSGVFFVSTLDERGSYYHEVAWKEDFVEVWVRGVPTLLDNHRAQPARSARYLAQMHGESFGEVGQHLYLGEELVCSWSWEQEATFTLVNGLYVPWAAGKGFHTSQPNDFTISSLVLWNQDAGPAQPIHQVFDFALYPGMKGTPVPGFPPNRIVGRQLTAEDHWAASFVDGARSVMNRYSTSGYM